MPQPGTAQAGALQAPFVVHADDLHDALMAGLGDKIEIRTGVEITSVRTGEANWPAVSTAKYTFQGDLIVAADGARSLIRRRLAPERPGRARGLHRLARRHPVVPGADAV